MNGNQSVKNILGAPGASKNAWGGQNAPGSDESGNTTTASQPAPSGKGKKKKGKEHLFTLGAFPTV